MIKGGIMSFLVFILGLFSICFRIYTGYLFYWWFIVTPFNAPALGLMQFIGVLLFAGIMFKSLNAGSARDHVIHSVTSKQWLDINAVEALQSVIISGTGLVIGLIVKNLI